MTIQALAAVLGGAQSLHTNSRDEALCLPTEASVRIALRTQQIIAEESGVADTADPMGGAYFLEFITDRLERGANDYLAKIDAMGGALRAIEGGYPQREIQASAYAHQKAVESGSRVVVGLNRYCAEVSGASPLLRVSAETETAQRGRLAGFRARRDAAASARALDSVEAAARSADNLMPPIIAAVKARATVGEICGRLRSVFGEHRPAAVI